MLADAILDKLPELPPAPVTAIKLLGLLKRSGQDSIDEAVETIRFDAVITARLLKAANSAYMAGRSPVESVEQAVMRLGYMEIMRLVMALNIRGSMMRDLKAYGISATELWAHSIKAAISAQELAEMAPGLAGGSDPSVAFTAGLLHDIGKVTMDQCPPLMGIGEKVKNGSLSLCEAEKAIMGVDHAQLGSRLLARWKLPPHIVESVAWHHHPHMDKTGKLSAIIFLANEIAHGANTPANEEPSLPLKPEVADLVGLKDEQIAKAILFVHSESERIIRSMSVV